MALMPISILYRSEWCDDCWLKGQFLFMFKALILGFVVPYVNWNLTQITHHHITRVTRNFDTKHDIENEKMDKYFYEATCNDKPLFDPWGQMSRETSDMSYERLVLQLPDDLNPGVEDVDL